MSGFLSKSTALTVLNVDNPAVVTASGLKKFAFQSIDALQGEEKSIGWTSIEDMLDTAWAHSVPEKDEWLCFALRVDKRKVPTAILKKHYDEAIKAELEEINAQGLKCLPRGRKRELKERVKLQLMAKAEPVPTTIDMAMNMHTGMLFITTTSKSILTQVEELMGANFGVHVAPFSPRGDVQKILHDLYTTPLQVSFGEYSYTLQDADAVTLQGFTDTEADNTIEVTAKNDRSSADAGLSAGLSIASLKINMERTAESFLWTFTMNRELSFARLCLPALEKKGELDFDAMFLERLYLIEQLIGVVHSIFDV